MTPKEAATNYYADVPGDKGDLLEENSDADSQEILDQYIAEILRLAEGSGAIGAGKAFIKGASPVIKSKVVNRAKFAIDAVKSGKKPNDPDVQAELEKRMRQTPQMNPLITPDTYGVLAAVSAQVQTDPDLSARVKRFYRAMVDNWIKSKVGQ